jgi:hypothetical protein
MSKPRLRKPSPALVISCIALFVALSGSSYAVIVLPKNSVGPKQIRANAVGPSEIKTNAVRSEEVLDGSLQAGDFAPGQLAAGSPGPPGPPGPQGPEGPPNPNADTLDGIDSTGFLRNGAVAGGRLAGTYPNPTIPGNSLTGSDINESTLAEVPSATNAGSVDGQSAATFNFKSIGPDSYKTLFTIGGLTMRAQCIGVSPGTDKIEFRASTTADNSFIWTSIDGVPVNGDWDVADGSPSASTDWFASTSDKTGVIVYRQGDTAPTNAASVVTVTLAWRTTSTSCETVGSAVGH